MKQDRNVQEDHISCTQPGSLYTFHLLDTRSWNPNSSIKRRKPKVLFRRIFQLVVYFLIDKIVHKQPYLQLVHTCTSPYYRLYIYSGKKQESFYPTYHNCAKCPTKSRGHFVSGLSPFHPSFSFSRNLVQIQSWHGAIKPELGELLGVTGSVATKPHHSSDSKTKQFQGLKNPVEFQGLQNPVEFSRFVKQQNSTFKGLMVWFQGLISSDSKLFQTSRIPSSFHVASPLAHFVEQVPDKDRYASNKHPAQNCRCRW